MKSPISDDQDDLDRTDKLPVLHISDASEEFPAFDPSATVVIDPAVQARVEELGGRLAQRERELSAARESLRQRGEVSAEIEGQVERLRVQLRAQEQQLAGLLGSATRLTGVEQAHAVLQAELQQQRREAGELRSALDEAGRELQRTAGEWQVERAGLQDELLRLGAEARQLRDELEIRRAAFTELESQRTRLDAELASVRSRLELELRSAGERFRADIDGVRTELEAEREAHRILREAQSALEQEKLQQGARQGDEVARLQLDVARLGRELADAHNVLRTHQRDLVAARRESARVAATRAGLERTIRDRDTQIETLLERLRSREARRRFEGDLRVSAHAESEHALREIGLPDRLAAIETAIAARGTATDEFESRLAQLLQQLGAARQDLSVAAQAAAQATAEAAAAHAAAVAAEAAAMVEARARADAEGRERAAVEARRSAEAAAAAAAQANAGGSRYLTRIDDESGIVYILAAPRIVIGRGKNVDLVIAESYISGRHAVLRLGPDVTLVEDSGSTNGVFVNGRRVQRDVLRDGDVVSFGRARFRFHSRGLITAGS